MHLQGVNCTYNTKNGLHCSPPSALHRQPGSPLEVLSGAGTVGDHDRPVEIFPVEAGGVGGPPFEDRLVAEEALVASLVRGGPELVVVLRARHPCTTSRRLGFRNESKGS